MGVAVVLAAMWFTPSSSGQVLREPVRLVASDVAADDLFGQSVSVSGNVTVVGAPYDDDNGSQSGSVYVFRRNGSTWAQEQKLLPSDGALGALFGGSVSISGNVAVVGAQDHENGGYSGSAYVFRRNGSRWIQEQKLLASDGAPFDYFGLSVSVSGDVAIVGGRGRRRRLSFRSVLRLRLGLHVPLERIEVGTGTEVAPLGRGRR